MGVSLVVWVSTRRIGLPSVTESTGLTSCGELWSSTEGKGGGGAYRSVRLTGVAGCELRGPPPGVGGRAIGEGVVGLGANGSAREMSMTVDISVFDAIETGVSVRGDGRVGFCTGPACCVEGLLSFMVMCVEVRGLFTRAQPNDNARRLTCSVCRVKG